jgi:HK97 family phage prohead protease
VALLLNHEGMPLARTKSGTLELRDSKDGLGVKANLDLANPLVQTLASSLKRGDVDEMSFAFRVTEQKWEAHDDFPDDDQSLRTITAVNLNRGDVSAVTFGASDATDIDIVRSLEGLSVEELTEARAVIDRRLHQQDPGGMPGDEDSGGMPPHLLELLRVQPNPILQEH